MRQRTRWLLGLGLSAGLSLAAALPCRSNPKLGGCADLAWLEGSWSGAKNGVQMEEHWTSAAGDGLVGMHKDVKDGRMVSVEFFRIGPNSAGIPTYFASPNAAPPTPFAAIEFGAKRVVFENLAHDFPQRVLYWLGADGALHARIEGTLNGAMQSEEWSWSRDKAH